MADDATADADDAKDAADVTDSAGPRARRRASRAAGPAAGEGEAGREPVGTVAIPVAKTIGGPRQPRTRTTRRPPRRQPNRRLVALAAAIAGVAGIGALGGVVAALAVQHRHADALAERNQRFVDTASQTVVNMYSYTQDNIDESVTRFVGGTSGPLHDTMANNVENLKEILRATKSSSEAVINAAALEGVDNVADNASVLVATRVTATDVDGVNKPSQPYRLRVIVHEDDNGNMTAYDLKYPDGGN